MYPQTSLQVRVVCENFALSPANPESSSELANILEKLAASIRNDDLVCTSREFTLFLRDSNGNPVGVAKFTRVSE